VQLWLEDDSESALGINATKGVVQLSATAGDGQMIGRIK
jgi:hypothetical protein